MQSLVPQYEPLIKRKYAKAVYQRIMDGKLGCCDGVRDMEQEVSVLTGSRYVLATTSGTAAIMLALWSLRLKPGAKVLFPAYTFLAGANAASVLGYKVVLGDIRPDTLCMGPEEVEAIIASNDFGAVIFVNHNGYVGSEVSRVKEVCDKYHVPMIEDSSQGMFIGPAGRTGDLGIFSLSVPKIVTGGQGGLLVTDNPVLMEVAKRYHDQGGDWRMTRMHQHVGINLKYTDIQAAYVLAQLKDKKDLIARKLRILGWYRQHIKLEDFGQLLVAFAIYRTKNLRRVQEELVNAGFASEAYYRPVHHNPPYKCSWSYPVADRMYDELLYLPSSLNLSERQVRRVCQVILETEGAA
jgi:perosamine synthetase